MKRISILLLIATAFAVSACSNGIATSGDDDGTGSGGSGGSGGTGSGSDQYAKILASRVIDYSAALKSAALRLTGDLPTLAEIKSVSSATGAAQKTAYEAALTDYMSRPTFATQMFLIFRDMFKTGGASATAFDNTLDTAAAFAAELTVNNSPLTDLFTKATNNCPTLNLTTGAFTDATCTGSAPQAGVLTNNGIMKNFFSNFAFRRARWVQETFMCKAMPGEISTTPTDVGAAAKYTGVQPFKSISSPTNGGGRIDFLDVSSALCANCHSTLNHIAPLFAHFDANGAYQTNIVVPAALPGAPVAMLTDYVPAGETLQWRFGVQTPDLPSLGAAMAKDPGVASCFIARLQNLALDKQDIVDALAEVPAAEIQTQVDAFTTGGSKMKDAIFAMFTSQDFISY